MDDAAVTPPSWGNSPDENQADNQNSVTPPADLAAVPPTASPADPVTAPPAGEPDAGAILDDALLAFNQALETKVAVYLKETYGESVLDEYLKVREQNDLTAMLLFEAQQGINIEQIFREQESQIMTEMEAQQPGSVAALFGLKQTEENHG